MTNIEIGIAAATVAGGFVGWAVYRWGEWLTPLEENSPSRWAPLLTALATAAVFGGYAWAYLAADCLGTPSVRPEPFWLYGRLVYHFVLIALLVAATVTDFRDYTVPDAITLTGMLLGVGLATVAGHLEIVPLWISWDGSVPEWILEQRILHGFTWSVTGLAVGGGVTWLVRIVSQLILGQEALGFGDVTMAAMIGSFLGWQPTLLVLAVAPLAGLAVGPVVGIVTGRSFIGFGPFLAAGTFVVLGTWRWSWRALKEVFGDWISLAILGGVAFGALIGLLILLRFSRTPRSL